MLLHGIKVCFAKRYITSVSILFLPFSEQFGMRTKTNQAYGILVNPYKKKISSYMAFHTSVILTG